MRIYEIDNSDPAETVINNIDVISYNDPSGWYVSGGCYEFAEALYHAFPKGTAKMWTTDDARGNDMHAFTEYNGRFYDINGEHGTPDDVITDGDYDFDYPLKHIPNSNGYADPKNVKAIVNDLTDPDLKHANK